MKYGTSCYTRKQKKINRPKQTTMRDRLRPAYFNALLYFLHKMRKKFTILS